MRILNELVSLWPPYRKKNVLNIDKLIQQKRKTADRVCGCIFSPNPLSLSLFFYLFFSLGAKPFSSASLERQFLGNRSGQAEANVTKRFSTLLTTCQTLQLDVSRYLEQSGS